MSEFSDEILQELIRHLVRQGIPEEEATGLVFANASAIQVDGDEWVLVDTRGAEVRRVPLPPMFR